MIAGEYLIWGFLFTVIVNVAIQITLRVLAHERRERQP